MSETVASPSATYVVAGVLLFTSLFPSAATATALQQQIDLSKFGTCAACQISLRHIVTIGEGQAIDDPGQVIGHHVLIGPGPTFVVPEGDGTTIQVYGPDGRFIRSIGREGGGPGEFRWIVGAAIRDSLLYVADMMRARLIRVRIDGTVISEHFFPLARDVRQFVVAGSDVVIAAANDRHPDRVGLPLHLVDLSRDSVLRSTGSRDGRYAPSSEYDIQYLIAPVYGQPETVWLARRGQPRFERWDVRRGEQQAVISGDVDWFPRAIERFDGTRTPPTLMQDFVVDPQGRFWVLTLVPDPQWRQNVTVRPRGQLHSFNVADLQKLYDTRLDMYDIRSHTHVKGPVWDDRNLGLTLLPSGEPILFRKQLHLDKGIETIAVFRLMAGSN